MREWHASRYLIALPEFQPEQHGGHIFTLVGQLGREYVIERSSNLADWTPYSTNVVGDRDLKFIGPPAMLGDQSFFRGKAVAED